MIGASWTLMFNLGEQSAATQFPNFDTNSALVQPSFHWPASSPKAAQIFALSPPLSSQVFSKSAFTAGSTPADDALVSVFFKPPAFACKSASLGAAADMITDTKAEKRKSSA